MNQDLKISKAALLRRLRAKLGAATKLCRGAERSGVEPFLAMALENRRTLREVINLVENTID